MAVGSLKLRPMVAQGKHARPNRVRGMQHDPFVTVDDVGELIVQDNLCRAQTESELRR